MRPAIRLAALSEVQVIYVFTHDSIGSAKMGQLTNQLNNWPRCARFQISLLFALLIPAEVGEAWRLAIFAAACSDRIGADSAKRYRRSIERFIAQLKGYAAAATSWLRQRPDHRGGAEHDAATILIAPALKFPLRSRLVRNCKQKALQRASSPTLLELFEQQPGDYRDEFFRPPSLPVSVLKQGVCQGWDHYIGPQGDVICLNRFGGSAPGDVVMRELGFQCRECIEACKGTALSHANCNWR